MGPCFNRVGCDRRFLCAPSTSGNPFCEVNGGQVSCADVPLCARRAQAVSLQGTRTRNGRFSGCSKASVPEYALKEVPDLRKTGFSTLRSSARRCRASRDATRGFHVQDGPRMGLPQRTDLPGGIFRSRAEMQMSGMIDINCRGNLAGRLFGFRRSRAFRFRIGSNRSTPSVSGQPANPN